MADKKPLVVSESIENKILTIRGQKVMLDADLAELYGVETKRLNEQVRRNSERFPEDFMFRLTAEEKAEVVANCDHLAKLKFSSSLPFEDLAKLYTKAKLTHDGKSPGYAGVTVEV